MKKFAVLLPALALIIIATCGCNKKKEQETCTSYACSMHPDKTSTQAATCPVCGMDMECK